MGAASGMDLSFPEFPRFPPCWEFRLDYLHWWLCTSLIFTGTMQTFGMSRHDFSFLAGLVQFIGALVLLPRWKFLSNSFNISRHRLLHWGCRVTLIGLGLTIATQRKRNLFWWGQAAGIMELMRVRDGTAGLLVGLLYVFIGLGTGVFLCQ